MIPPIIVTGAGRTGTSIVAEIIQTLGVDMGSMFPGGRTGQWEDLVAQTLNRMIAQERMQIEVWEYLWRLYAESKHTRWGWKDPGACDLLPWLVRIFPDAQWVVCNRDVDATVDSYQRAYGSTRRMAEQCYYLRTTMARVWIKPTIEVQLETLRQEPLRTVRRIAETLDLHASRIEQAAGLVA